MSRVCASIQVLFIFVVYCQWRGGDQAQDGLHDEAGLSCALFMAGTDGGVRLGLESRTAVGNGRLRWAVRWGDGRWLRMEPHGGAGNGMDGLAH